MSKSSGVTSDCRERIDLSERVFGFHTALLAFAIICSIAVVAWKTVLGATFTIAIGNDAYTHIILILPLSFFLLLSAWKKQPWRVRPAISEGLVLISIAALLAVGGSRLPSIPNITVDLHLSCEMLAFVIWIVGAFLLCFGRRAFRVSMFPLLFLAWLIPLPSAILTYIVHFLQHSTASCANVMLALSGVPVLQNGVELALPGMTLQVAEECSSIRSSMTLVVSSMAMSYLLLRSSWARGIVIIAALPLAIFKNGLRVLTLALLGIYVTPTILDSPLHHQGGVLFLTASLIVMFAMIWLVGKAEGRQSRVGTS